MIDLIESCTTSFNNCLFTMSESNWAARGDRNSFDSHKLQRFLFPPKDLVSDNLFFEW